MIYGQDYLHPGVRGDNGLIIIKRNGWYYPEKFALCDLSNKLNRRQSDDEGTIIRGYAGIKDDLALKICFEIDNIRTRPELCSLLRKPGEPEDVILRLDEILLK
jgi:hypothetical protein